MRRKVRENCNKIRPEGTAHVNVFTMEGIPASLQDASTMFGRRFPGLERPGSHHVSLRDGMNRTKMNLTTGLNLTPMGLRRGDVGHAAFRATLVDCSCLPAPAPVTNRDRCCSWIRYRIRIGISEPLS